MSALSKIRSAGFEVYPFGDGFQIAPLSKLTIQQRGFLKTHKAEIVSELKIAELKAKQSADEIIKRFVICYSPRGKTYEVEATSTEHAEWLIKMNPKRNA